MSFLKAIPVISRVLLSMPANLSLTGYFVSPCAYVPCVCVCVFVRRRPGLPSHAPPPAAVREEPQQRDADPPQERRDSVGTRSDLHAVLLHALPPDGVGEPQC